MEAVIEAQPDLVIGFELGAVTQESLAGVGIRFFVLPEFCTDPADQPVRPDFDLLYEQIDLFGRIFDADDTEATVAELRNRVDAVAAAAQGEPERTAATLSPLPPPISAYGSRSIAHTQMEAAGFRNVFEDIDERRFEPSFEEVINRDPDVIVLIYINVEPEEIKQMFLSLPGAQNLTAVRNDDILVQPFQLTGPTNPLIAEGLENLQKAFGS